MNFSFFLEQAKRYTAIYITIKLKTNYVLEYNMVHFLVNKKRLWKKKKGHLQGYYMTHCTTCHNTCLSKLWPPNNHEQSCTCKACLVVNHPEIALTLEKCIIQGKIIVCFTWTKRFFLWIMRFFLISSSYRTSLLRK